jgi:hypothetical protein
MADLGPFSQIRAGGVWGVTIIPPLYYLYIFLPCFLHRKPPRKTRPFSQPIFKIPISTNHLHRFQPVFKPFLCPFRYPFAPIERTDSTTETRRLNTIWVSNTACKRYVSSPKTQAKCRHFFRRMGGGRVGGRVR